MNAVKRLIAALDRLQQSQPWLAFPIAVWKKFGEDQAGNLAALIAYYGFASLFPLLLVLVTVLDIALAHYPTLKANENVLSLQEQLTTTENQISFSRQHYNATVLDYNNSLQTFPNVLIAGPLGFTKREFFAAEPEAAEVPVVNLG